MRDSCWRWRPLRPWQLSTPARCLRTRRSRPALARLPKDSDQEALAYLTHRYGDYVLLEPPLKPVTWVLWFAPAGFAAVALLLAVRYFRRRE